jgi:uncharacterized protein
MTRSYTRKLTDAGLGTLTALGRSPDGTTVPDMAQRPLDRLRNQARLQLEQYRDGQTRYELVAPSPDEPGKGLAALPAPSPLDVFFDIEAHPWAFEDGLEYLLGTLAEDGGEPAFRPIWAHDRGEEKRAFEAFIDLVIERLDRDPAMHVYHYGAYEPAALKRLMVRHATREEELDRLLRGGVLVDLYNVVRQGVRVSEESYSLKKVEKLYAFRREGPVTEARYSLLRYEDWIRGRKPEILDEIAAYNRDDCVSTWRLRAWLEERRPDCERQFGISLARPEPRSGDPSEDLADVLERNRQRVARLTEGVPADAAERTDEQQARWLLAQLLEWHRRDAKPEWWAHYDRLSKTIEELPCRARRDRARRGPAPA